MCRTVPYLLLWDICVPRITGTDKVVTPGGEGPCEGAGGLVRIGYPVLNLLVEMKSLCTVLPCALANSGRP